MIYLLSTFPTSPMSQIFGPKVGGITQQINNAQTTRRVPWYFCFVMITYALNKCSHAIRSGCCFEIILNLCLKWSSQSGPVFGRMTHVCLYLCVCVCICLCVCLCVCVCMCVCVCVCLCMSLCAHMGTCARVHVFEQLDKQSAWWQVSHSYLLAPIVWSSLRSVQAV